MFLFLPLLITTLLPRTTALTSPPTTYPNGTANPFYPCGYTALQQAACPYRCYTSAGALLPDCYQDLSTITALIAAGNICTQCRSPSALQSYDYPGGCTPLSTYFAGQNPSPCGFVNHRLRSCAWICEEAQVPFNVCSIRNMTGEFELCERCMPQCSSPRIVFEPPYLPSNFSISAGSCSTEYGPQEDVACPFRCLTAGNPNMFCSLTNKSDEPQGFTSCVACT